MTQWMADALKDLDTAPNAVKLFVQWCQTAPGNEGRPKDAIKSIQGRMKFMASRKSSLATKNLLEDTDGLDCVAPPSKGAT